ncbi:TetR/AcrR family transcriptional regulator [Nocardia farcinica]|uniref:TetR/AcrR family transcriptional regulator n=1 Tax=Nocardia farcinica TaxID=37329 RepID=UPI0027DA5F48|nr:TetR family transcriptional regulator [Nocardia farcinica]
MRKSVCPVCRRPVPQPPRGRPRRYCSRSCQARAYRSRRAGRTAGTPVDRPPRPARLTRVGIARAAVALADRDGIEGLTLRRLAGDLGVATAALYRHYPDRDALLGAMTELVLAETEPSEADSRPADWRAALTHDALTEWRRYRTHPWLLPVLARIRPPAGPVLFDSLEATFTTLDRLGLSGAQLLNTYLALSGLVQGLALLWYADRGRPPGAPPPELVELIDPVARPTLHKVFAGGPAEPDVERLIGDAVDLLLTGIEHRREHGSP